MAQQQVRGSIAQTAERGADDLQFSRSGLRELASRATTELNQTLTAPGKLSWWYKTIGTMYHLAERSPAFRPVFQAAQGFIDDVSRYAADAAERAPKLLPRLETWRDIMKSPISAEDNKAVGKPIFEGTLSWTRDADGRPVRVDALIEAATGLSIEEMADELVSRGAIEERTLRMWRGMPDAQFESAIRTRYENSFLQPGIVWTDDELASMFSLTPAQIALYREFRAAVDRSLDTMARADMLRFAGEDVRFLRDPVMGAETLREAASLIVMNLSEQANAQPDRAEQLMATGQGVMDRMQKVMKLQAQGYAPLSRFGKYTVDVVVDGNREYFGLFETAREANKMAERMRAEFGAGTVTQGTLSDEAFRLFAGITPESLELFGNMLGLDSTGDEAQDRAFQEYLRLTKTNRSALRRLIHRKGIAGFSEDVGRVLASFAYSNARQTAAGLHMGDLSQAVSDIPKEQGELKDVAVKLAEYIKNPQEEAQAIRGLLFAQYLGGSVASAFVNMTQPAAVTFPWLSQHGGAKMAAAEIGKAAKHIGTRGYRYEPDLAEALKTAEEDGIVSPQEVHQLMAQARGSGSLTAGDGTRAGNARALASNSITRLSAAWGKLFSAAEQLNRRITFIAAYRVAKQKRMENPTDFARRAVTETQFVYSKASKMQWGRGAVGGTLMTFKTYSVAYMELMSRLWSQGAPGSAERKAGRKAVALMLAMVLLMGGGGGLPFMEDAEDLIDGIAQIAGYNVSTKKARQQFLIDTFGADAADFIERGVSGLPGVPLDVSGRLGLGNLIPGTGIFLDRSNHTRDVLELLGPVGDLGNRIVTGARKALSGDLGGASLEVSPVAVRNVAKGVDMAVMDQYRDTRGRKVLETTDLEAALKAIGFQPASVAKVQDANYLNQRAKDFYSLSADRISSTWAAGIYEKDSGKVQEARDMIAQWNEDNPDQPMMIRMPNILRRVREMGKDKSQRIADTAPRAMRQQLREELLRQ
ncbi:MAG: PLxRFG domain-containing protein [Tepidiphilus sp.]|nr:PLxRFG domain-containing protein [Tepidiphilus sp.]